MCSECWNGHRVLSAVRRDDEEDMLPLTLSREMVMWWQEGQGDAMQSMVSKKDV